MCTFIVRFEDVKSARWQCAHRLCLWEGSISDGEELSKRAREERKGRVRLRALKSASWTPGRSVAQTGC